MFNQGRENLEVGHVRHFFVHVVSNVFSRGRSRATGVHFFGQQLARSELRNHTITLKKRAPASALVKGGGNPPGYNEDRGINVVAGVCYRNPPKLKYSYRVLTKHHL